MINENFKNQSQNDPIQRAAAEMLQNILAGMQNENFD